jgi:hypothetical protein
LITLDVTTDAGGVAVHISSGAGSRGGLLPVLRAQR